VKWLAFLCAAALANDLGAAEKPRNTNWKSASGAWADAQNWSNGIPDMLSRVAIHGHSEIQLTRQAQPAGVGGAAIGTGAGDRVRLHIDGGELLSRRDFIQLAEADGSDVEVTLNDGGLHGVSAVYLGGAGNKGTSACRAVLRIRGGTFVSRLLSVGWGQRSEATLAIEGSRPAAVHLLDYLSVGAPGLAYQPSNGTLSFTLDAQGVTPITIQSRRMGVRLYSEVPGNHCRLQVALSDVPPRDDITLVHAHVPTIGVFDDLPEGAEVRAIHAGRTYRWTLTYRGGTSRCDVALTSVQGHAPDAPATRCRAIPAVPTPLWETVPARAPEAEDANATPAFDGAEGFGRFAAGGRGGRILWVENLNDSGPGSFRDAVQQRGPRILQFRVGGTIALKSTLSIREPYLTVDGQSAPQGGITFAGQGFMVMTHDVILRHFRIRPGHETVDTDALSFSDATRCIVDHLSVGWSTDEVLSITGLSDEITVQWCVIHEGLNLDKHGYASIAAGERVTWHHNLLAHHVSRVPRFANIARTDFRNNVLYNWGHTAGYGQFERVNYVGNYLKPGPSTKQKPLRIHTGDDVVSDASLHLEGNVMEGSESVTKDNWLGVGFEPRIRAAEPFAAPLIRTTSAVAAYEEVLSNAGALPSQRDTTDARVIREARTGTGRIIDRPGDVGAGPVDALNLIRVPGSAEADAVLGNGSTDAFDARWTSCPSVVLHDGQYRMWYSSWFTPGFGPMGIGLASSPDGIHWKRENEGQPVLTPSGGDAFDSGCVMGPAVHFDGTRYLMWYTGTTQSKHGSGFYEYRIGVASSPDGITWTRESHGKPVIDLGQRGSPDEVQAATPSVVREKDGYRMWYAAYAAQSNHTICVARSGDGITWQRENEGESVTGLSPAKGFGPSVCLIGDAYVMLYMALESAPGIYAARSKDGHTWHMLNDGAPVITPSGAGFDRDLVGHPFLLADKESLRVWVTGYDRQQRGIENWRLRIGLLNGPLTMLKN
jgi:pectate lyase